MQFGNQDDTICALSTAPGVGALSVIRISGSLAIPTFESMFSKPLAGVATHTVHFGKVVQGNDVLDEVVAAIFRGPRSFTGEDTVEVSCHGSPYIVTQLLHALLEKGCRLAEPGEFSMRAFANAKVDLSQAEAIADLIASSSAAAHKLAMNQLRGGFSQKINGLREQLINFASLIELELDFSEEDVEFADRQQLTDLVEGIQKVVKDLIASFATGHAIKNGIPVAILGAPNMGKSTLLNTLLDEERAIVSEIAGTTRDIIEDVMTIEGVQFRFIDTAGLRDTEDVVESIGIGRAFDRAGKASVILYLVDAVETDASEVAGQMDALRSKIGEEPLLIPVANKVDKARDLDSMRANFASLPNMLFISATDGIGIDELRNRLVALTQTLHTASQDVIVSNVRHYQALTQASASLSAVLEGVEKGVTSDFLAIDIRKALYHLGEITGAITTEDLLGNIFSKFCIGK